MAYSLLDRCVILWAQGHQATMESKWLSVTWSILQTYIQSRREPELCEAEMLADVLSWMEGQL